MMVPTREILGEVYSTPLPYCGCREGKKKTRYFLQSMKYINKSNLPFHWYRFKVKPLIA